MFEVDEPVSMSNSGVIVFPGYGVLEISDDSDNSSEISSNSSSEACYAELEEMRFSELEKFNSENILSVRRENIYDDLLKHFKKRTTIIGRVILTFEGEDGVGDGVSKDAFSDLFSEKLMVLYKRCLYQTWTKRN